MTAVLSPRILNVLTNNGEAIDGVGMLGRLEAEVRRRAEEEWKRTGETDSSRNWIAAESQLIIHSRPEERPGSTCYNCQGRKRPDGSLSQTDYAELQALRRQNTLLQEELTQLRKQFQALDEDSMAKKMQSFRSELAETDRLLVERNQHCREVELAYAVMNEQFKTQEAALSEVKQKLEASECRNAEKDATIKELALESQQKTLALKEFTSLVQGTIFEDCALKESSLNANLKKSKSGGMLAQKLHRPLVRAK
jgi:hypothetical protein